MDKIVKFHETEYDHHVPLLAVNLDASPSCSTANVCRSMDVVVQPAVSWMDLNDKLQHSGLFFPPDPGPSVRSLLSVLISIERV